MLESGAGKLRGPPGRAVQSRLPVSSSDSEGVEWDPTVHTCNTSPDNAGAANPGTPNLRTADLDVYPARKGCASHLGTDPL